MFHNWMIWNQSQHSEIKVCSRTGWSGISHSTARSRFVPQLDDLESVTAQRDQGLFHNWMIWNQTAGSRFPQQFDWNQSQYGGIKVRYTTEEIYSMVWDQSEARYTTEPKTLDVLKGTHRFLSNDLERAILMICYYYGWIVLSINY